MAMIVISHNIEHVWSVCTRMLVLRQGRFASDVQREATTKARIVADIIGASAKRRRMDTNTASIAGIAQGLGGVSTSASSS